MVEERENDAEKLREQNNGGERELWFMLVVVERERWKGCQGV